MANIFISHSRRDEDLVTAMAKILRNIGHDPIIEEFIPEEEKEPVPYEEIRKNVSVSNFVFLFLTDNIVATEYTHNWVAFEVGLTASAQKRLFVFERAGVPVPYPIPYLTDYMIFDAASTNDLLNIQTLSKKLAEIPKDVVGAGMGALLGLPFGPIGLILGGLAGGVLGASASEEILKVQCPHCSVSFNYYSPQYYKFSCPACRKNIHLNSRRE